MIKQGDSRISSAAFIGIRTAGTIAIAALALAAGNYYLDWGFFGSAAKPLVGGAFLLLFIYIALMPRDYSREKRRRLDEKLEEEREWERTRDKSNDTAEIARLSRDIGLTPNTSPERTHDR